ncbi:hypothetical protein Cgig2_010985 [Carnegiea gigantea]|uniref:X8 domain-containing protein n=1 Tax=Carnegiea gigantea TaxID=171969 RepID=A0A9Q1JXR6_9CARY|nr:hypothetical protein Cgig2_010985 [Carnegiea gigantea]
MNLCRIKTKSFIILLWLVIAAVVLKQGEAAIGVNWEMISHHRLSPKMAVDLLKENKISKVKLFDTDLHVVNALRGSSIQVMVGIPNEMLSLLSSSPAADDLWVRQNLTTHLSAKPPIDISLEGPIDHHPSGLAQRLDAQCEDESPTRLCAAIKPPWKKSSLVKANLAGSIKLVVPCNADAYESSVASRVAFRLDLMQIMTQLVSFLYTNGSPFSNRTAFNQSLINHALSNKRTPLRSGVPPMDIYLFRLLDEGAKSTLPDNFKRHCGIFLFDRQAKYALNLGLGTGLLRNAQDVRHLPSRWCVANPSKDLSAIANHFKLACSVVDCTTLSYNRSCNGISEKRNISYAFNSYYQLQKFGMVTILDPSVGDCRFLSVTNTDAASSSGGHCGIWIISRILIFMGVFMVLLLEEKDFRSCLLLEE